MEENKQKNQEDIFAGMDEVLETTDTPVETMEEKPDNLIKDEPVIETTSTEPLKEVEETIAATEENLNNDEQESVFKLLAEDFKNKGIFEETDFEDPEDGFKFDGTEDSFKELLERKSWKQAIEYIDGVVDKMEPKAKAIMKKYLDGINYEEAAELGSKQIEYSSVTKEVLEKDPGKAESLYREFLKSKDFDQDEIDSMVETAKTLDELTDKGLKAAKKLQESVEKQELALKEAAKAKEDKDKLDAKQRLEKIKSSVFDTKEFIPGIQATEKLKENIYKNLTEPVAEGPKGPMNKLQYVASKNPEGFNKLLAAFLEYGLLNQNKNGDFVPDFSKIVNVKKSTVVNNLTEKLHESFNKSKNKNSGGNSVSVNSKDTIEAIRTYVS